MSEEESVSITEETPKAKPNPKKEWLDYINDITVWEVLLVSVVISVLLYFIYPSAVGVVLGIGGLISLASLLANIYLGKVYTAKKIDAIVNEHAKSLQTAIEEYQEAEKELDEVIEAYKNLEYRKYIVPLVCKKCGIENQVEMDLMQNTEFKCIHCGMENAIYVNFFVAAKTNPLNVNDFINKAYVPLNTEYRAE